jgi:NAD(P)-dependent dehydrogenase (short-subunit alcohol dehydrogenase family)
MTTPHGTTRIPQGAGAPVALVTGASRGLGRALAARLAARGWHVVIDARDPSALAGAAAFMAADRVVAIPGDVADPAHRERLMGAVWDLGRLDLLVNNAGMLGVSAHTPLADHPAADLEAMFAVNVVAPVALAQIALPHLARRRGAIVNISSDAAVEAYEGWGGYGATKAALDHVSATLAAENPAVRVYAVDPGEMATAMLRAAYPGEDMSGWPGPEGVVPALLRLIDGDLPSGRYRAADLRTAVAT